VQKCPYCDFNSHKAGNQPPRQRYINALIADLERAAVHADGRGLSSVFLGGGTPSLFKPAEIGEVLAAVERQVGFMAGAEITMEANPGAVERGSFAGYRSAGVNRVSIGAQSFNAELLKRLGRIHGPEEIVAAHRDASEAGFDSINLDLMFALPGQDLALAAADLEQALALETAHLSYYQLTLEPNTVFHSRPPEDLPSDELAWDIQEAGHERLVRAGFERYEISAFARQGYRSVHNLNYWRFGDYLAIGAGAHGKYTTAGGDVFRYEKPRHPLSYMDSMESGQVPAPNQVGEEDIGFEFMLNVLRLPEGFSADEFEGRTGLPIGHLQPRLTQAIEKGLLEPRTDAKWRPTELGLRFLNDLQGLFLP
jgi:oxygen-independent coproporphyrinogen-3 oxidase